MLSTGMTMRKKIKFAILTSPFVALLTYWVVALYFKTLTITVEEEEKIRRFIGEGGRIIFACWHQRFFGGFVAPRILGEDLYIMISRSRDGDFASSVVRRFGWMGVRGSGSRGGREALKTLVRTVSAGHSVAHIIDGPTGPPRVIKPGLIALAQRSGAVIVPAFILYNNAWTFNSWDRFMVPKPFSRIVVNFGDMVSVPPAMTDEEFEDMRKTLESFMIREYEKRDRSCGH